MVELISGGPRHPFHDRTIAPQLMSVVVHAAILSTAILLPLLVVAERLPVVPTMIAFVAPPVMPSPPPPPPRPKVAARAPETKVVGRPESKATAAPIVASAEIIPESPVRGYESFGTEGGIEGGLEGGTLGEIVGGLVDAPLPSPPPPPAHPSTPSRIGGQIRAPELLHRVEPVYPDLAVLAKVTGTLILEAVVAGDGRSGGEGAS